MSKARQCSAPAIFSDDKLARAILSQIEDWKPLTLTEIGFMSTCANTSLVFAATGLAQDPGHCAANCVHRYVAPTASGPSRQVRVYADGVFDLFHMGHAEQLKQIKQMIPHCYLVVGVCSDADTLRYKGGPTVMTEEERSSTVMHCKYVDEVYRNPPFYPTLDFVDQIKCDLVAHDALPYQLEDMDDCYSPFKQLDRFLTTQRTPCVSTTEILQRILDNTGVYMERQMVRKFGNQRQNQEDGIVEEAKF